MLHHSERWSRLSEMDVPEAVKRVFEDKKRQCLVCEAQTLERLMGPGGEGMTVHTYVDGCARCSVCMVDDLRTLYEVHAPMETIEKYHGFIKECIPCMWRRLKKTFDAEGNRIAETAEG